MIKNSGSGLMDYMVPTAIVGLALGMGLVYLVSNGSILKFLSGSSNMTTNTDTKTAVIGAFGRTQQTTTTNTQTITNPTDPRVNCNNGVCQIDLGSFILTGIPSNPENFFDNSGSNGVGDDQTDFYAGMLDQIADNLAQHDNPSEAYLLNLLKQLSESMADSQAALQAANTSSDTTCRAFKGCNTNNSVVNGTYRNSLPFLDIANLNTCALALNCDTSTNRFNDILSQSGNAPPSVFPPNFIPPDFRNQFLTGPIPNNILPSQMNQTVVNSYLNSGNVDDTASLFFGLWGELSRSNNLSPDVRAAIDYNVRQIANIAAGIDITTDASSRNNKIASTNNNVPKMADYVNDLAASLP